MTHAVPAERHLPVVAVVGRPNVGKSSLVNRILGRREAIVEATPGVTRDRGGFAAEWGGRRFEVVDTGGLEAGTEGLEARAGEQAHVAIDVADVIVLVVDVAAGVLEDDLLVADVLRRSGKPLLVAANKVDDARDVPGVAAFYRLGLGDPIGVSAVHGRGSGDLLDSLTGLLASEQGVTPQGEWASATIIGRPNVGKSSLLNAVLGDRRAIVDAVPGTTRDPVDSHLAMPDGRVLRIVDTAGMRRRVEIKEPLEYFSWVRSRATLTRVDVALLVIDAASGVTSHDQRLAEEIVASGRACVVAVNKWDLAAPDAADRVRLERDMAERLRFIDWAVTVRTSALTQRGISRLLPALDEAITSHRRRLSTGALNRFIGEAQEKSPHPRTGGRSVRILYSVQASVSPPTVVLFTTARLEAGYLRYIENRLREHEPFRGSPIVKQVRTRPARRR